MPGRAATTSWTVIARFAGCAEPFGGRIDAGGLEQVAVLPANAGNAREVDVVYPLQDELAAYLGRLRDLVAAAGLRPGPEQVVGRLDADRGEFFGVGGPIPSTSTMFT